MELAMAKRLRVGRRAGRRKKEDDMVGMNGLFEEGVWR